MQVAFETHLVTYFVLWTYLIPLSLFVSIELVRIAQMLFMNWDETMVGRVDGEDVYMTCKNSNLNEDLGRIEHIFSDKTGTLTQNLMNLRGWSIDGITYTEADTTADAPIDGDADGGAAMPMTSAGGLANSTPTRPRGALARTIRQITDNVAKVPAGTLEHLRFMLRSVALCNTVVPSWTGLTKGAAPTPGARKLAYEADSPDELALLEAAQANGVELRERTEDGVTIAFAASNLAQPGVPESSSSSSSAAWVEERWKVLQILEFSSDRKRMSVIVQADTGAAAGKEAPLYLITKGADSIMMGLMASGGANPASALAQAQQVRRLRLRKPALTLIIYVG